MKLKEQKKFGILWLSIGAALFLAGLLLGETEYGSYISGFGGGLTAVGLVRLLRVRRLSRDPEKAADYDASLKDERTAYVANKARSMAFFICVYVQLAAALGVSRQTIISLESGKYNPSILLAHAIARLFGTQIEDIFLFEEEEA